MYKYDFCTFIIILHKGIEGTESLLIDVLLKIYYIIIIHNSIDIYEWNFGYNSLNLLFLIKFLLTHYYNNRFPTSYLNLTI